MENKIGFRRLGTMLDCSRNGVMKVEKVKEWVDITGAMGYNTLLLYTEDTYELDDNPYFGYMRGRYTKEELKEIDKYAVSKGMEFIPCIQTLAHLNAIMRWPEYGQLRDTGDILLAGDERVYALIDKMFATFDKCLTGRIVNVGMDEAFLLGRGKYAEINGNRDRTQILLDHIKRVAEIAAKYDFKILVWSDMFYYLATGTHYDEKAKFKASVAEQMPKNVEIIYWDYCNFSKKHFSCLMKTHKQIDENSWYAGGGITWLGFAPHNHLTMKAMKLAVNACLENGVKDVFFTMWGDNGNECSKFAIMPSLFYLAEYSKGNKSMPDIKKKFYDLFGVPFDRFMLLDLPDSIGEGGKLVSNSEKYLLYNDCFMGIFDTALKGGEGEAFAKCARKLGLLKKNEKWGYLFKSMQALCEVLAVKAELGKRTHEIYASRDMEALKVLIEDYKKTVKKVKNFAKVYAEQWFADNKPHGFDVQDLRLGGLMNRLNHCRERLEDLYNGKIDRIEELEEKQLPCPFTDDSGVVVYGNWALNFSANPI